MELVACFNCNGTSIRHINAREDTDSKQESRLSYRSKPSMFDVSDDLSTSSDENSYWFTNALCQYTQATKRNGLKRPLPNRKNFSLENQPIPCNPSKQIQRHEFSIPVKPAGKGSVLHTLIHNEKWNAVRASLQKSEVKPVLTIYDEKFCTPLILACKYNAPVDIVELMLSHEPNCCSMPDEDGNFPLHYACRYGYDTAVLQELINCYSQAASKRNRKMRSPLQIILERPGLPSNMMVGLLRLYPASASLCDKNGDLPLHYCGKVEMDVKTLQVLIDVYPIAIRKLNRYDAPPILLAASRGAPLHTLKTLLRANPSMVKIDDKRGLCSIFALWNQHMQRRKVDPRLNEKESKRVAANRRAIARITRKEDLKGKHKELWKKIELLLYTAIHNSVKIDSSSWNVLHAVAAYGCPPEMVQLAFNLYPDQIQSTDEHGKLPLHHAALAPIYINQPTDEVSGISSFDLVLTHCSNGILTRDHKGRIPLHCALENGNTWELGVRRLVEKDPNTLSIQAGKSKLYPFMVSAAAKPMNVIHMKRRILMRQMKIKHKNWKAMRNSSRKLLLEKEQAREELECFNTTYLLLRLAPTIVEIGTKARLEDDETKKLREVNLDLWREKQKLRKELYIMYKEIDQMEEKVLLQKENFQNGRSASTGSSNRIFKGEKTSILLKKEHNSALRGNNPLAAARNKYVRGRVKFLPDSVYEFEPCELEHRDDDGTVATMDSNDDDGTRDDDILDNLFEDTSHSSDSCEMSIGTNLLEEQ